MEKDPVEALKDVKDRYAHGRDRPLGTYLVIVASYLSAAAGTGVWLRRRRQPLPPRLAPGDVALVGLATHRLARLITRDAVTSPLRAPFTRFEGVSGAAELEERVTGEGPRHAVGELLTCPFCMAQWIASCFSVGLVAAPRATRLVAGVFAAVGIADFLHMLRAKLD